MKLRYTGEFPPLDYVNQYPNWRNAYDEEGEEDQDETTLKPHEQQLFVDNEVSFTAADVIASNGTNYVALIEVIAGVPYAINVLGSDPWGLETRHPTKTWTPIRQDWVPENERVREVSLDDTNVFPLRITSRLPQIEDGKHIQIQIAINGFTLKLD